MTDDAADPFASAIERGLAGAVPEGGPQAHLYRPVADYPSRGGKRLRPRLCLAACVAARGGVADAIDAAVALELLHNAFLVHDDIADASHKRRGAPTLHERFGLPRALNAGDGLFALALERVAAAAARHPQRSSHVLAEFAHMLRRTVEGQAIELGWCVDERWDIPDEEYLAMVRDKTCWYSFIHPLRVGTLLGGGSIDEEAFVELGFLLGAVFQIRDDLDNLLSDPASYDKDLGCDLVEAKRTLPVLHLLRHGSRNEVAELRAHLGPEASRDPGSRLAAVVPLLERRGSLDHARATADALAAAAAREFKRSFDGRPRNEGLVALMELTEQIAFGGRR